VYPETHTHKIQHRMFLKYLRYNSGTCAISSCICNTTREGYILCKPHNTAALGPGPRAFRLPLIQVISRSRRVPSGQACRPNKKKHRQAWRHVKSCTKASKGTDALLAHPAGKAFGLVRGMAHWQLAISPKQRAAARYGDNRRVLPGKPDAIHSGALPVNPPAYGESAGKL
jgi:hypothetical protein